jgi:hypothetical protein
MHGIQFSVWIRHSRRPETNSYAAGETRRWGGGERLREREERECVGESERDRDRDRNRDRDRDRDKERDRDRERDRQSESERKRERGGGWGKRETERINLANCRPGWIISSESAPLTAAMEGKATGANKYSDNSAHNDSHSLNETDVSIMFLIVCSAWLS